MFQDGSEVWFREFDAASARRGWQCAMLVGLLADLQSVGPDVRSLERGQWLSG